MALPFILCIKIKLFLGHLFLREGSFRVLNLSSLVSPLGPFTNPGFFLDSGCYIYYKYQLRLLQLRRNILIRRKNDLRHNHGRVCFDAPSKAECRPKTRESRVSRYTRYVCVCVCVCAYVCRRLVLRKATFRLPVSQYSSHTPII